MSYLDYANDQMRAPRGAQTPALTDRVDLFRKTGSANMDLPGNLLDHVNHGTGALEGLNAQKLVKGSQIVVNPCN